MWHFMQDGQRAGLCFIWQRKYGRTNYLQRELRLRMRGGQILICVAGRGYYQEWGKDATLMKPGDCINIPAGVKHWHGAAPDSWFSHLAIEVPGENGSNEWLEALDDEQYGKLK